jgi:hypothetical protein
MEASQHLRKKLQDTLGAEAAGELVTSLDGIDAVRADLGELRHEMQLGFARMESRFAAVDAKFDALLATMNAKFAVVDEKFAASEAKGQALLEKGLKEQTRFFFLAWAVLLAAFIGLYARQ